MSDDENRQLALPSNAIEPVDGSPSQVGQMANVFAARSVFNDYLSRKADNTIRRQAGDLGRFADYLWQISDEMGEGMADFAEDVRDFPLLGTAPDVRVWQGITWGLIEGFRNWMVKQGDAVGSINVRLSTVKTYSKLVTKAGVIPPEENALIRTVVGYARKEARRIDNRRKKSRRGDKKAEAVAISEAQAAKLIERPDTPQGRRDAVMICLLLEHGLRVGEVTGLTIDDIDLKTRAIRFYRPKVDKMQVHRLTPSTFTALQAWFESGDAPEDGPLLRSSRKGGRLDGSGMTERAITGRVRALGEEIGIAGLSAHDCRHYWATFWASRVDVIRLQEAGGWSSLAMPRRYIKDAEIANQGMLFEVDEE
ncbi:MAG: site-specific integrase [Anaerolineae bacterium]|nr:site-specific integrase [Anaerolineae bacterium]